MAIDWYDAYNHRLKMDTIERYSELRSAELNASKLELFVVRSKCKELIEKIDKALESR